MQLWEKNEGLPVRRQHHKKLGSVYAYRRELEDWWMGRSKLGGGATPDPEHSLQNIETGEFVDSGFPRIIVFPLEAVHAAGDRGPLQQLIGRFADGLKEDLNLELSRPHFDPVGLPNGARPVRSASTPGCMRDVAREFGSEFYLAGAIRYAETVVRVSMQLMRSADSVCLWSGRFEIGVDRIVRAQAELAHKIVQALPGHRSRQSQPASKSRPTGHGPAYHACMLGFHFWQQRTRIDLIRALGFFQDAIHFDPSCAEAYAGLTDTYVALAYGHFMPAREAIEAAQRAMAKAMVLGPRSTHVRNAEINFHKTCTWNWQAAERACQELLDSGSVEARTLQLYADLMINRGRHDDAISLALHAHRLDPDSDSANAQVSFAYFYAGDYDRAISFIERAIRLKPLFNTGHALLGRAEAQRRNWDKAIESFERGLALCADSTFLKALLAYGHAGVGDAPVASRLLREIEEQRGSACFPAVDVSGVHAMLSQDDEAMQNISTAFQLRDMKVTYIPYDPRFTLLRSHPRFQQIASSVYVCAS